MSQAVEQQLYNLLCGSFYAKKENLTVKYSVIQ